MIEAYFLEITNQALQTPKPSKRTRCCTEGALCFAILHYEVPSARLADGKDIANGTRPDTLDQSRMIDDRC